MMCEIHGIDDGYVPTYPEGTMLRAWEDLSHAERVLWGAIVNAMSRPLQWICERLISGIR